VWPQDRAADVHDLLEARHHLLQAGNIGDADQITAAICSQLETSGAWDQESSLIHDTLSRLPADSSNQADWMLRLSILADRQGDNAEANRQTQRAFNIYERVGNQRGMAGAYHMLGIISEGRGDYDEAARQYQRALDINEQLDNQRDTAGIYHQLGILAQRRGDYDEAARQYQRSLDINEQLGDQAGTATSYSQLGNLEIECGGPIAAAATWHIKALVIRLRLGVPQAVYNLRRLAACRGELGAEPFTSLLTQAASDTDLAETIASLLDELDKTDDSGA
jgi:tetratricopeptide (TPR) repeat protein